MVVRESNPFLQGNFGPVTEEIAADDLEVVGELPRALDGMYVRNGPNPQFAPLGRYHWFDGDGMLHGVRLQDGKASYRNRYVRTAKWQAERAAGRALVPGLLEPPQPDGPNKVPDNTANTSVIWHDGRLLALMEAAAPEAVRLPGLETLGPHTFGGKLVRPFTAHPKIDVVSGELLFFGYDIVPPYLQYSVATRDGQIVHTTPIDLPIGVMMHDFAITERYAIFMDLPVTLSLERARRGEPVIAWEPERGARFGILPRRAEGSRIRWFASPPCYVFHVLNAYEDGDEVVLDACRRLRLEFGSLSSTDQDVTRLYRWRFDLAHGTTKEEPLDDVDSEFPRVNDAHVGRRARYGYAARFSRRLEAEGFLKYDLATGQSETHLHGPGRFGGEPVFVPRPGAADEDDGWVVTYVYDGAADRSELVVVNVRDFAAPPVARLLIPRRVPYGFHGTWIDADHLAQQRP